MDRPALPLGYLSVTRARVYLAALWEELDRERKFPLSHLLPDKVSAFVLFLSVLSTALLGTIFTRQFEVSVVNMQVAGPVLFLGYSLYGYRKLKMRWKVRYLATAAAFTGIAVVTFPYWRFGVKEFWPYLFAEAVLVYLFRKQLVAAWARFPTKHPWISKPLRLLGPRPALALFLPLHFFLIGAASWVDITWVDALDCTPQVGVEHVLTSCELGGQRRWYSWLAALPGAPEQRDAAPREAFPTSDGSAIIGAFGSEDSANGYAPIVRFARQETHATIAQNGGISHETFTRYRVTNVVWALSPFAGLCHKSGKCVVTSPMSEGLIILDEKSGEVLRELKIPGLTANDLDRDSDGNIVLVLGHGRGEDRPTVRGLAPEKIRRLQTPDPMGGFIYGVIDMAREDITFTPLATKDHACMAGERFFARATEPGEILFGDSLRVASLNTQRVSSIQTGIFRRLYSGGNALGAAWAPYPHDAGQSRMWANFTFLGVVEYRRSGGQWVPERTLRKPDGGRAMEYDPQRGFLYRANYFTGMVEVINPISGETVKTFNVGVRIRHMHLQDNLLVVMSLPGATVIDLDVALADIPLALPDGETQLTLK